AFGREAARLPRAPGRLHEPRGDTRPREMITQAGVVHIVDTLLPDRMRLTGRPEDIGIVYVYTTPMMR
ncbi:MAG: hypothetical protein MUO64_20150, partial [Anaerolineales bacterium]|nr:hypothetical protein [Anaerolineales bacterium]